MAETTLSSSEFSTDMSHTTSAARRGPVIITDQGIPAHVLLTFQDYQRMAGARETSPIC